MKPSYDITRETLQLISSISEKIGEANALYLIKANPTLRKQNQIKTIQASLQIEGNTLSVDQITAILENKRVVGPEKDILEVLNAVEVYKNIRTFKPEKEKDFLKAHKLLLNQLLTNLGMGRLWQTLILMQDYPIFEFLPFETLISKNQLEYYQALSNSDKEGKSTRFIEYMLKIMDLSLSELLESSSKKLTDEDRIWLFL